MATIGVKLMLSWMKLTDKAASFVVANDGQGVITIKDFAQLNDKAVESLCRVLWRPGGTTWGVSNPSVAVLAMAEANLQGMIYFIKNFKIIGHTCTHAGVELAKFRAMYHQRDMEESHNDNPTINSSIVRYDSNCSHKPRGTSKAYFFLTKGSFALNHVNQQNIE